MTLCRRGWCDQSKAPPKQWWFLLFVLVKFSELNPDGWGAWMASFFSWRADPQSPPSSRLNGLRTLFLNLSFTQPYFPPSKVFHLYFQVGSTLKAWHNGHQREREEDLVMSEEKEMTQGNVAFSRNWEKTSPESKSLQRSSWTYGGCIRRFICLCRST